MPGRTIAVGDIHGCAPALETLLAAIELTPDDTLITLGDYIDRGPDSRGVIDRLLQLQSQCQLISLKGNHELLMLRALADSSQLNFWMLSGGLATLASYGGIGEIPAAHIDFLQGCRDYYETDTHLFVHANYDFQVPLAEQTEYHLYWAHLGYVPPPPHVSGKIVVMGHTPQRKGNVLNAGHMLCIDTYCFGSGCLTALDVATGQIWQANKLGQLRK